MAKIGTPANWKAKKPGNYDGATNTSVFNADVTELGYPIVHKDDSIEPPEALVLYPQAHVRNTDAICFFTEDYRFQSVWTYHTRTAKKMRIRTTLTPDFSLYRDYPKPVQMWNHYRNMWCGSYWQYYGAKVIPTVTWSDESSFDFCFDGIQPGCTVALTVIGLRRYPVTFTKGFDRMIDVIHPKNILCLGDISKVYRGAKRMDNIYTYKYEFTKSRYPMVMEDE